MGDCGLETFKVTWDGNTQNALAGGILLTHVSGSMPTLTTVCTDIGGTVYLGCNYVYSDPQVFNGKSGIQSSWGAGNAGIPFGTRLTPSQQANAAAAIQAAADILYHHSSILTSGTTTDRAALQLAVWEALYDTTAGSRTLGSRFMVNSGDAAAISEANTWLGQVDPSAQYAGSLLIPTPESQGSLNAQEMLYNVTPVPEPTTMIAGALLLLPFGASTLRWVRRNRAA
jgi:hypothetical protein